MAGGNSARAYNAGKSAQNAVENNYMASLRDYDKKPKVIQEHTDKLLAAGAMPFEKLDEKYENCNTDKDCHNAVEEEWRKESKKTAILEKELVEKGELELKHLNGYPSIKEQKDESYSSQMVRSANRSKTVLGQREAMSWNSIGKPQEAGEALAIAISRNDDRLGLTEREREKWNAIAASSPGDLMVNHSGLATRQLLTPKVEKRDLDKTLSTSKIRNKLDIRKLTIKDDASTYRYKLISQNAHNIGKGVVASRINIRNGSPNIAGSGLEYAWKRHNGTWGTNKSAFTITKEELKDILRDPRTVGVTAYKNNSGNYIRTIKLNKAIGVDAKSGGKKTKVISIITDSYGNLVNTFPGRTY